MSIHIAVTNDLRNTVKASNSDL